MGIICKDRATFASGNADLSGGGGGGTMLLQQVLVLDSGIMGPRLQSNMTGSQFS